MRETINAPATDETAKYKYQGKERDIETGYDYFEARLYDSAIGRFMQVDPMSEKFKGMNGYTGMGNNPINLVDPTGMVVDDIFHDQQGNEIKELRIKNDKPDRNFVEVKQQHNGMVQQGGKKFVKANSALTVKGAQGKTGYNSVNENFEGSSAHTSRLGKGIATAATGSGQGLAGAVGGLLTIANQSRAGGTLDPKQGLNPKTLNVIAGVAYNQDETGNHIWGASLEAAGIPDVMKKAAAHAYSLTSKGTFDEPNDVKAFMSGSEWVKKKREIAQFVTD